MEDRSLEAPWETLEGSGPGAGEQAASDSLDTESQAFVGRWNRLVSSTNWEKGRIIYEWREALIATNAPATEYSDDAWARRVGAITPQHVGRLRRVFHRFGESYAGYERLYWSHFQAALDWDDAEMWLEGATQERWSISQMRERRWETLGGERPVAPLPTPVDEDFDPRGDQRAEGASASAGDDRDSRPATLTGDYEGVSGPRHEGPDFGDEDEYSDVAPPEQFTPTVAVEGIRPFESLPELPEDVAEAVDSLKLAIIRHKQSDWRDLPREHMLAALDALRALALG